MGSLIVMVAAFSAVFSFAGQAHADTTITNDISTTTTWSTSGGVYIIQNKIAVNSGVTLTIQPGTIVKFQGGTAITVNGTLDASGAATSSIYFTSYNDDVGGDTNGDGSATSPLAGDWASIYINSGASTTINHTVVRYGGYTGCCSNPYADVYNNGGVLNIFNSEVATSTYYGIRTDSGTTTVNMADVHGQSYGIYMSGSAMLNIASSTIHDNSSYGVYGLYPSAQLTLTNNIFSNSSSGAAYLIFDSGLVFTHSGNMNAGGGYGGFLVNGSMAANQTWTADNMPYVVSGSFTVPSGQTLTVNPDAIVKSDGGSKIIVNGGMLATGTAGNSIYFTSVKDDSVDGQDTNGDGASTGSPGDWAAIKIGSSASTTINYAVVRYGGYTGCCSNPYANVYNDGGTLNLLNSEIATSTYYGIRADSGTTTVDTVDVYGQAYGIYMSGATILSVSSSTIHDNSSYGLYASYSSGHLDLTDNLFSNSGSGAGYLIFDSGLVFTHATNTATGTGNGGFLVNGSIATGQTWTADSMPYIISGSVTVSSAQTLTIDPDAIVKFDVGSKIIINGEMSAVGTSGHDIYFTSLKDDFDDDTNGDDVTTSPAAGDWASISVGSGASSTIDHAIIRYGGYTGCCSNPYANLYNYGGTLNVFNSEIATSTYYGIRTDSGTTTVNMADVHGQSYGIYMSGSAMLNIASSTIHDNSSYGLYGSYPSGHLNLTGNTFFNSSSGATYFNFDSGLVFTHSGNANVGGGYGGFLMNGSMAANQTWTADKMPYIVSGSFTIPSGKTLTVDPDVVVKFDGGAKIIVDGEMSAAGTLGGEIFFTSIKDDLIDRDTNGDGNATSPAASDWASISVNSGASTTINHAVIRYGGYTGCCSNPYANLYNSGGTLNISSSTIAYASYYGIRNSAGTTTVTASDIGFNSYGLYVDGGSVNISATSTLHDNYSYSAYNGTSATSSLFAQGNYWGDPAGPYNVTYNVFGTTTSPVSDYVDFKPYVGQGSITTPLHYVELNCPSSTCGSVRNQVILLESTSGYVSEVNLATSTWNVLSNNMIVAATSSPTLTMSDVYYSDFAWKGGYSTTTPGFIVLNTYYLDANTSAERQNTIEHELGHALGLDHSYTGNVMYFAQSTQTAFGPQDIADFNYLWN